MHPDARSLPCIVRDCGGMLVVRLVEARNYSGSLILWRRVCERCGTVAFERRATADEAAR